MSRITVVLFHLVLTASVTVWANSERQMLRAGQESSEDLVVTEQATGSCTLPAEPVQGASAEVHPSTPVESQASNLDKERAAEPAI